MAKTATHDVFDMSDDVKRVKTKQAVKQMKKKADGVVDAHGAAIIADPKLATRNPNERWNITVRIPVPVRDTVYEMKRQSNYDSFNSVMVLALQEFIKNHGYSDVYEQYVEEWEERCSLYEEGQ